MIDYRRLGAISPKQHTQFKIEGRLVAEHVLTREGFNDSYSILYQDRAPTHEVSVRVLETPNRAFPVNQLPELPDLKRRHFRTQAHARGGSLLESRATLLCNEQVTVGVARPTVNAEEFFVNGDADELFFVSKGSGVLETMYGELDYTSGDYLFIPKGTAYRFAFSEGPDLLIVEGKRGFGIPREYRLPNGQIRLDAPYNHRDFRSPSRLLGVTGNPPVVVKRRDTLTIHEYTDFPYRVLGWDGWCWPFAFSVHAYEPKTGRVHLPPNIHTAFAGEGFYVMNFVPRLLDYHEQAIPSPWPHSSVDCDEVLYYVHGNFTSRKGIEPMSLTLHPAGIPHGPHPERYEGSIGHSRTDELAIMVDTLNPLNLTRAALALEDTQYHQTWNTREFL